jgi:hypothetical protein
MQLQILRNGTGTHATVSLLQEGHQPESGAHLLLPGESFLGVGYERWYAYRGTTADLLVLQSRAWSQASAVDSPAAPRVRSGFARAYLTVGLPSAVLVATAVELLAPLFEYPGRSVERVLFSVILFKAPLFTLLSIWLNRPFLPGERAPASNVEPE